MRKTLLLLLSLSLGLLGSGSNDLFAKPGYFKADPVLSNIGSKIGQSWFNANTVFAKFKAGKAVAPPTIIDCNTVGYREFADGSCSASINFQTPTSPDGVLLAGYPIRSSDGASVTTNPATFTVGHDTIIFTFQNSDGQTTCRIPIQVVDVTPPTISGGDCGDTITVNVNSGFCFADGVDLQAPTVVEACSNPVVLVYSTTDRNNVTTGDTILPGAFISDTIEFRIGFTTVTFTATDSSGLASTCRATVRVIDNIAPVLGAAAADITAGTDAGQCSRRVGIVTPAATDNCGSPLVTWVVTNQGGDTIFTGSGNIDNIPFPIGVNTVTYTATDGSGNTDTDALTVTISDTQAPTISGCPSDVLFIRNTNNNGTGDCNAMVNIIRIPGTDNCTPTANLVYNYTVVDSTSGDTVGSGVNDVNLTLPLGTYYAIYTVRDVAGNTSQPCSVRVAVRDNEIPVFTSASLSDISLGNEPGVCSNDTLLSSPNVTDNCGNAELGWIVKMGNDTIGSGTGPIPSFTFPVGLSTLIWTVTDESNLQNFDTVLVTVADTTNPTVFAGSDILVNSGTSCSSPVTRVITFDDNCEIDTLVENSPYGVLTDFNRALGTATFTGTFPTGSFAVTFTVTDVNGRSSTELLGIVVSDAIDPTINNFANIIESTDPNVCTFTRSFNISSDFNPQDNCSIEETTVNINGPTIDDSFSFGSGGTFTYSFERGLTTVTVTTADSSGNTATDVFTVNVSDNQAPVVFFQDTVVVNIDPSSCTAALVPLVLTNVLVEDNCSSDDFLLSSATNNHTNLGDTATAFYNLGFTTVVWNIRDEAGNVSTKTVVVWVRDITLPGDSPNDTIVIQNDINLCSGKVKVFAPNSLDSCGIASVQYSINDGPLVTGVVVDNFAFPVATNLVEWFTTDNNGNTRVDTSIVIVRDSQAPTITLPANTTLFAENGCNNDTTFTFSVADNCEGAVTTSWMIITYTDITDADGDTVANGAGTTLSYSFPQSAQATKIRVTSTDNANNSSTREFFVKVIDNRDPVINCPNDTTFDADADVCGKRLTVVANNAILGRPYSDNCGVLSVTGTYGASNIPFTPTSEFVFDLGVTPVSITVTDVNGNTVTCNFNITVGDINGPAITSFPNDTTVDALVNECSRIVFWNEPTVNDACTGNNFTITKNFTPGQEFPLGTTTVTYTFRDQNGNTTTRSFTITVLDRQLPVINESPSDTTIYLPADNCVVTYLYDLRIQDNCDAQGVDVSSTYVTGSQFTAGIYKNDIVVRDKSGNTVSTSFNITVIDTITPTFTEFPSNYVTCDPVLDYTVSARDNCGPLTFTVTPGFNSGDTIRSIGTHTITVTVADPSGRSFTRSFTVTLLDAVTNAQAGTDAVICSGAILNLTGNTAAEGETVHWSLINGNAQIVNSNSPATTVNYNSPGIYTFVYTIGGDGPCPVSRDTVVITVNSSAIVNAGTDQSVTTNSANLNAAPLSLGATGTWTVVTGPGIVTSPNSSSTSVTNLRNGTNTFRWTVEVPGCGTSSDEITITTNLAETIGIPTAFTPNGDGDNDRFSVADFVGSEARIAIYNRWGSEVFTGTSADSWDGRYEGKELPVASYYYVIEFSDGSAPIKGYVSIIR